MFGRDAARFARAGGVVVRRGARCGLTNRNHVLRDGRRERSPLEDVAIAMRVKRAGHRIWFGSGKDLVRTRMYSSFEAMWEGWQKNLYRLMAGTPWAVFREMESAFPWIALLLMVLGMKFPFLFFLGILLLIARQTIYGLDLARNQYAFSLIFYYVPATFLYTAVLWASYRSHVKRRIAWKGREYSIEAPESVK